MIAKVLLCVLVVIASVCAVQQITSEQFRCLRACKREDLPAQSCLDLCVPSYEDAEVESDSEQAAPITGTLIWESYMAELFGFLKRGGSIKGLQLLKTPIPATWNTNASALAAFGNNITQWGVEYNPTAKQLPHEYIAFLKNIKVNSQKVDASTQQRINELKQSIEQLKTNIETETAQCKERHARYERLRGPTDFSEYENRFCSRIVTSRELLTVNEVTLQQTLSSVPGADVAAAIEAFNAAEGVYGWTESFIQKLSTFLTKIETNKADTFGIVVTKSSSSQSKQTKEWSWESLETGKNNEFLPTTISGSSHSMNTSADNFKMEIEAKGYYAIEVAPGKWFDMSVLKKYANGPFIDSSKKYFGADGRMPLLTQRVYLLYKPTVSLFLEKVDAQYIESVSKVSANIKLGPFTTDSKSLKVSPVPSSTLYKVSLSNNDETPVVVALDNLVLP